MAEFRILKPPTFVSRRDDAGKDISAFDIAAEWLSEQCGNDWEPVDVVARGIPARVLLTGSTDPETLIVFRREPSKGKR